MRAYMFSIIICIFLIPCYGNAGMSKSNFFDLEYTEEIEKLESVSSSGVETMEIYFKNDRGYVYILCLPLTENEYYENNIKCNSYDESDLFPSRDMEIEIDKRWLKGERRDYENDRCSIRCTDFHENITLSILFIGEKNDINIFLKLLKHIKYKITQDEAERYKNVQTKTANYINTLDVPIYKNAANKKVTICLKGLRKRIEYEIPPNENPLDVLQYYIKYFKNIQWIPYLEKNDNTVNLENGTVFYFWKNQQDDVIAEFISLSYPVPEVNSRTKYIIYIDISPVMAGH